MRQPIVVARPRGCTCRNSIAVVVRSSALMLAAAILVFGAGAKSFAQEAGEKKASSEAALAAYADAANFQTGGAIDLAIDGWKGFLKKYPSDAMAPEAAHYLGVCYMQREAPDYEAAAAAFAQALRDKKYKLREESLANRGWCLYASAGEGQQRDPKALRESLRTFATLRSENPRSRYLDRALFYSGEAAYALGQPGQAIEFYDQLLAMPTAKESPLRCDAFYARGVAQEDLKQFDKAIASYKQLLAGCGQKDELVTDVHLRIGNLQILEKEFLQAVASFAAARDSATSEQDRSYALFRQGYALAQSNDPGRAAATYEQLLSEFPDSTYAAAATLASAQSSYRSGDLAKAAERFQRVLTQTDPAAATEAAHWLARIEISRGNPAEAQKICERQIEAGSEGEFAVSLRLDLAESLSMLPDSVEQSMVLFERAYRDAPMDPLASRALYNAAFSAYQIGKAEKALSLALEFIDKFPGDTLTADVQFVTAESQLQLGKSTQAVATYRRLLGSTERDNMQRPIWVLRAAAASNRAKQYDDTVAILKADASTLKRPAEKAEAEFLLGQAHLAAGRSSQAADAFQASVKADPNWKRAGEASLLAGRAMVDAGKKGQGVDTWRRLIRESPDTAMADQARYKLAQAANADNDFAEAVKLYDDILRSQKDDALIPYALYGKGWSLIQIERFSDARAPLDRVLREFDQHPVSEDALLARGITLRNLDRLDDAKIDLEAYLAVPPKGTNLGHALYELALIDQTQKQPARAAVRLERLVKEVPDYPAMEKVLYELGWSHRESGDDEAAVKQFTNLISRYGNTPLAAEAAYYVGQRYYAKQQWDKAADQFRVAAENSNDSDLAEKAYYRLGWSQFKAQDFTAASDAFRVQAQKHADGKLALDAMMMVGECDFKQSKFRESLAAYSLARQRIRETNDTARSIRDPAERQVRELVLLHGGQSASQLKQWQESIDWLAELRERFPSTTYLPQAFYETGFAYQQSGDDTKALKFFGEVAQNFRNETAARARFMMGEIYFGQRLFDKAIPEFQRVMFGFGADKAPGNIKNWQAKSGFEAGRCSELLMQQTTSADKRAKARSVAIGFFQYVIDKHPDHELVANSRQRLEALKKQ